MNPEEYKFPVFGTQGGGLVREINGKCYFVEAPPEGMGLTVGDKLPEHWSTIPANELARQLLRDEALKEGDNFVIKYW